MKKYIVESLVSFRHVHVVEAESEEQAFSIASEADDNWQEFLGVSKIDVQEYSEEHIKRFKEKEFWWDGVAFIGKNGEIDYQRPEYKF